MPPRMKRGNEERPERVPTPEHRGRVKVDEAAWESNERLRGTAEGLADERGPQE